MRAAQSKSFWKLLGLLRRLRFELRKRILLGSEKYVSTNTAARIVVELIRVTLPGLLFGLGTASVLLLVDLYLPDIKWRWAPFPLWLLEDRDSYATFLSTISGIGGVLIGLYYTGLTAVSSAAYAQAPGVLRNLLLKEPVGRFYIRLLAYTTFVALCLLAFYGIGFSPLRLALPFLILLSGVTILSFVHLGQHAFYFFDPTRLAGSIFVDLERWVKRATVESRFWEDPTFQNHAHQQGDAALKALRTLGDYSSVQKHLKTSAIADLAVSTLGVLYRYAHARQLIPSESKWYPAEYDHPDFYAAGELKIEMAVQTGGSVQPVAVAQGRWVEDAALSGVYDALQSNLQENNEGSVFRILEGLRGYIERLGEQWEIEHIIAVVEEVNRVIAPVAFSPESAASATPRWRLALVEYLCPLPISALLGFVKSLQNAKLGTIRGLLGTVKWERAETLYRAEFPRFVLPTLEWYRPRLEFETMAEGTMATPEWLVEQTIANDYLNALHKAVDLLLKANETLYGTWYKTAVDVKHRWAAAVVLNRQGEYIVKLQTHFQKIAASEMEFEAAKVLQDMIGWPTSRRDVFIDRIVAIERHYEVAVATEAHNLVGVPRRSHVPDFAGEFLSRTAQTVLDAITRNDVKVFQDVFRLFFKASIRKTTILLSSGEGSSEPEQVQRFNLAMGPLLDLVELSGYTIVISELRQSPEMWNITKGLWGLYLTHKESGAKRMQFLRVALQTDNIPGMFAAGELLRTNWRMRIQALFTDLPVERVVSSSPLGVRNRVRHNSPLVRILAGDTLPRLYRGIDVFVAIYFAGLPGNEAFASEIRAGGLIDALRRESRRNAPKQEVKKEGSEDAED